MPILYCSPPLVKFTGGEPEFDVSGASLGELLDKVQAMWPELYAAVSDGTRSRAGVMVFVNGQEVRDLTKPVALDDSSRVDLVTIAYGG